MIQETMTHACRVCESTNIVKNGTNRCGNAQSHCKDCGTSRVLKPKPAYWETNPQTVLRAGLERCSLRGVERIFDIPRQTVARWINYRSSDVHPVVYCSVEHGPITYHLTTTPERMLPHYATPHRTLRGKVTQHPH